MSVKIEIEGSQLIEIFNRLIALAKSSTITQDGNISTASKIATSAALINSDVDAEGISFDPEIHTGTKTKAGLWRKRKNTSANQFPAKPAHPENEPEKLIEVSDSEPCLSNDEPEILEDDGFITLESILVDAEKIEQKEEEEEEVIENEWTDAALGILCNQAAIKLNSPDAIRGLIDQYTPKNEVAHSRNIPQKDREKFARAIQAKMGIIDNDF